MGRCINSEGDKQKLVAPWLYLNVLTWKYPPLYWLFVPGTTDHQWITLTKTWKYPPLPRKAVKLNHSLTTPMKGQLYIDLWCLFFISYPKCWSNHHVVMPWCTYDITVTFQGLVNHFTWTSMSAVLKKAVKLNHSLTHLLNILNHMVYPMEIHLASFVRTKYEKNYIYIYSHHCPCRCRSTIRC